MTRRAEQKKKSHERILKEAADQFRARGIHGAGVERIMKSAGLTHGGFYAHFSSKTDLVAQGISKAMDETRAQWFAGLQNVAPAARLHSLVSRYLSEAHVRDSESGCPLPATAGEIAGTDSRVRQSLARDIGQTLEELGNALGKGAADKRTEQAASILAACAGGIMLARAVDDDELAEHILRGCRSLILRGIAYADHGAGEEE